ncbi:MAG: Serine/threonine protein phosphatase PrpC [Candidatus Kentron sp. G]|nr:MAG: Serine/threonine protein phosphatase PrpC [Candidatus Kentron sp. G]VFM97399.1 MAG: Serine/threonine protein phosphatase PrpC [Candidatus Kentron sp. G]VFM97920.1 MAG: Serine/threonine protein phosphatase PrpC [Candidatus Kentron sp. G]
MIDPEKITRALSSIEQLFTPWRTRRLFARKKFLSDTHPAIRYDTFAITSKGARAINEDAYGFSQSEDGRAFWVLADGLGGHSGGAEASRTAVAAISEWFRTGFGLAEKDVDFALRAAQAAIIASRKSSFSRMYTTVVMLVTDGAAARWAHVGDSRLYHFRDGKVLAWTEDHSVPYFLYRAGEIGFDAIRTHKDRNRLVLSLGTEEGPWNPGILSGSPALLRGSDAFLLCSDGFWEFVLETEMEADLAASTSSESWAKAMEHRLHNRIRTKAETKYDNYTVIAIKPM